MVWMKGQENMLHPPCFTYSVDKRVNSIRQHQTNHHADGEAGLGRSRDGGVSLVSKPTRQNGYEPVVTLTELRPLWI